VTLQKYKKIRKQEKRERLDPSITSRSIFSLLHLDLDPKARQIKEKRERLRKKELEMAIFRVLELKTLKNGGEVAGKKKVGGVFIAKT